MDDIREALESQVPQTLIITNLPDSVFNLKEMTVSIDKNYFLHFNNMLTCSCIPFKQISYLYSKMQIMVQLQKL